MVFYTLKVTIVCHYGITKELTLPKIGVAKFYETLIYFNLCKFKFVICEKLFMLF